MLYLKILLKYVKYPIDLDLNLRIFMETITTEEIIKKEEIKKEAPFIHLRCHSQYSILKALPKVKNLLSKTNDYSLPTLALTDYNSMYGALEFYIKAKEKNIKPIIGVEMDFKLENNPI